MGLTQTLRIRFHQFCEHLGKGGLIPALTASFFKYEEIVPAARSLSGLTSPKDDFSQGNLSFIGVYSSADLAADLKFPLESRRLRAQIYLENGYCSFMLHHDKRVIAEVWWTTESDSRTKHVHPHVRWFGLNLNPQDIYLFDMYVSSGQRGGAIASSFLSLALFRLKERGFLRAYGSFATNNIPALWLHRMLGYKERPHVVVRRFLFFETARPK